MDEVMWHQEHLKDIWTMVGSAVVAQVANYIIICDKDEPCGGELLGMLKPLYN